MKEEWKEKLRDGLADYEETVPEGLWSDIERAMAESRPDMVKPMGSVDTRRSGAKLIVWRLMAAAACVACGAGIFMYVGGGKEDNSHLAAVRPSVVDGKPAPSASSLGSRLSGASQTASAAAQPLLAAGVSMPRNHAAAADKPDADFAGNAPIEDSAPSASAEKTTADEPSAALGAPAGAERDDGKPRAVVASEKQYKSSVSASPRKSSSPVLPAGKEGQEYLPSLASAYEGGKYSASLYAANMTAGNGSAADSRVVLASDGMFYSMLPSRDGGGEIQNPVKGYVTSEIADEKTTKHHLPLRLGLSVRYAITDRWGVQSGLAYSYLSSDMTSRTNESRYATKQEVHFVGIPLAADYSLWRNRWLNVYVMAGGMVEKSVKATATTTYYMGDVMLSEDSKRLKMRQLQWSANAAAGIQLNLAKGIGLYAEPGLSYYFDNGSSIKTAYTDKPLNFSMKLGLRYSFEK